MVRKNIMKTRDMNGINAEVVYLYVRIFIDEFHTFFHTPHAALQAAQKILRYPVFRRCCIILRRVCGLIE